MIDYKTLKRSKNDIPTWDGYLGPVLLICDKKNIWQRRDLVNRVLEEVKLPEELANLIYSDNSYGEKNIAFDRVGWALSDLKISGLIESPERGKYKITQIGKDILSKYGSNIPAEIPHSQQAYINHKLALKNNDQVNDLEQEEAFELKQIQVETWFNKQRNDLSEDLLNRLYKINPYEFEHMMIHLLSNMGYKGTDGQSLVTQKSNDGGIDGIINQDPLGLQTTYVQVKRYAKENHVGAPEIDSFSGALRRKHIDRGVFITTSEFTSGAEKAAEELNISLVDGEMLANLMIQYKIGIQTKEKYELLEIDEEFFK